MQDFIEYWVNKKIGKLQKGSVKGFIKENKQISCLGVINEDKQSKIEKILQIRHLYSHRNGIVDEKFLQYFPIGFSIKTEHQMPISEICSNIKYLAEVAHEVDSAAIIKYKLA